MTGPILVVLAFLADAATVAATHSWPAPASSAAVYALLAVAWVLSLAAYFTLRSTPGDDGPPELPPDPDPPWWPEFERDFREYTRRGRRRARPRPRQPVA